MITLHNTLTGLDERFIPLEKGVVKMYHCGPTVYNFIHIGNLRSYVFADILRRLFEYEEYKVTQVINITDVGHLVSDSDEGQDKMILGSMRENKSAKEIADKYTAAFYKDLELLNIRTSGTIFPKATDHIPEQINMIQTLENKGFTYLTTDGVYFDSAKFPDYGKLGNINIGGLEEGARIGINEEKKNSTDFALWKFSPKDEKREQEWESPWGVGFPGWHIECSAMSIKYLGETFDIHTGGIDHIPVHHQNEIAQTESATGKKFVNYWIHNEHLKVNNEKISKSTGNQILLNEIIEKNISPLSYRYLLLQSNYRTPTNFTWESLEAAENAYKRLKTLILFLKKQSGEKIGKVNTKYKNEFLEAIQSDLNTPEAIATVWKVGKNAGDDISYEDALATLINFDQVLGLKLSENEYEVVDIPPEVQLILNERKIARENKEWDKTDQLREKIKESGFIVKDTEDGQILERI